MFGGIINRDDCFDRIVAHGVELHLPWATAEHIQKSTDGEGSTSGATDNTTREPSVERPSSIERTFRMSDLKDSVDDLDLMTLSV